MKKDVKQTSLKYIKINLKLLKVGCIIYNDFEELQLHSPGGAAFIVLDTHRPLWLEDLWRIDGASWHSLIL